MSDLEICRICLSKDMKLYNYNRFHLKQYYEQVMTRKVNSEDGLPQYFCYECAALLYKFHKFRQKCHIGQKELKQLQWQGNISLTAISEINRENKNLISPIKIVSVSNRVKTLHLKSKSLSRYHFKKFYNLKLPEIQEIKVDYDSDRNLSDIKKEMLIKVTELIGNERKKDNINKKLELKNEILACKGDSLNLSNDELYSEFFKDESDTILDEGSSNQMAIDTEMSEIISPDFQFSDDDEKTSKNGIATKEKSIKLHAKERAKRFEVMNTKKNDLDPSHWLKINLSEAEALEEFNAKALDPKYLSAAYKCSDCFKGFSKEDMLTRHVQLRHSESLGPIECRFCNMRFKWKCYLTRHITQHYTKYKCLRCQLMCPLKNTALFHNEYHNGVIRKCMHCGEDFRHLSTYYTHLRTHRSEHVCTLCGASFVSPIGLNRHKGTMHINTVINPEEEEENTYCDQCDINFETQKAYDEHVFHSALHAECVDGVASESPAPSMTKRRKKNGRRNPRKFTPCTICNTNFSTLTAFMKHHATEHKDEPVPSKDNERHICEICGASLAAGSVASHLNTHTREKLHTCTTCGMQFNSKGSMTRHQLTHTGEKPYNCTLCDKRFTQNSSMKLHYRTFHLKEPYPKRNRRKKCGSPQEASILEEYRNEDDSEENLKVDGWR